MVTICQNNKRIEIPQSKIMEYGRWDPGFLIVAVEHEGLAEDYKRQWSKDEMMDILNDLPYKDQSRATVLSRFPTKIASKSALMMVFKEYPYLAYAVIRNSV